MTFTSLASLLIMRLEQVVGFSNAVVAQAPKLREFFDVLDTIPAVRDEVGAHDAGRAAGAVRFDDVTFSYDGRRAAVTHPRLSRGVGVETGSFDELVAQGGASRSSRGRSSWWTPVTMKPW